MGIIGRSNGVALRDGGPRDAGTSAVRLQERAGRGARAVLRGAHPRQLHQRARGPLVREAGVPGGRRARVRGLRGGLQGHRPGGGRDDRLQAGQGGQPHDLRARPGGDALDGRHDEGRRRAPGQVRRARHRGEHEGRLVRGDTRRGLPDVRHGRGQAHRGRGHSGRKGGGIR